MVKSPGSHPQSEDRESTMPYLGAHGLLMFSTPPDADERTVKLAAAIGRLDKKAHRELGRGTRQWEDVLRLLVSAISLGLEGQLLDSGEELVAEAETLLDYYRRLPARNRVWYLGGTIIGVGVAAILGLLVGQLLASVAIDSISRNWMLAVCTLAALGSVASVLTRLTAISSLAHEQSMSMVTIGGASRPTVGALMAIAVFLVLQSGLVSVALGGISTANTPELKLAVAFLCGFSERFARDLLAKIDPSADLEPAAGESRRRPAASE
jgi:hypothetical protein